MEEITLEEEYQRHSIHPEDVQAIQQSILPAEDVSNVASLFSILKDPTRLQVVYALLHAPRKEVCVSDLAIGLRELGRDETTISHQLRVLRNQRIVDMRRDGRVIYYRLVDEHIRELLELALSHVGEIPEHQDGSL